MFTLRELKYIHKNLDSAYRSVYYRSIEQKYEVILSHVGKGCKLDFKNPEKAKEFIQRVSSDCIRICDDNPSRIQLFQPDESEAVYIDCGYNKDLAKKLVIHFRKSFVLENKRAQWQEKIKSKQKAKNMKKETKDAGLKF